MENKIIIEYIKDNYDRRQRYLRRKRKFNQMLQENINYFYQNMMNCTQMSINYAISEYGATFRKDRMASKTNSEDSEKSFAKFTDEQYLTEFHITRNTFAEICLIVHNDLLPKPNFMLPRKPMSIEFKVAIALSRMAHAENLTVISDKFGIGKSTVQKCLYDFISAINKKSNQFIRMPNVQEAENISKQFEKICKIPEVIGCIDKIHIPISIPKFTSNYVLYKNSEEWTSIILQGVVDSRNRFINVCCKSPGSSPDSLVLRSSAIYKNPDKIPKTRDNNTYNIIGSKSYPLLNWLLTEYEPVESLEEENFNEHVKLVCNHAKNTFSRLQKRWKILSNRCAMQIENVQKIILACCIVHNIAEMHYDNTVAQLENNVKMEKEPILISDQSYDDLGPEKRDAIKIFLSNKTMLCD